MSATAVTFLDITLAQPTDEEAFLGWWKDAEALLRERARLQRALLTVHRRGQFTVVLELAFPGSFKMVAEDWPWLELEARRPPAEVVVRHARIFRRSGPVIDITSSEMQRWLDERAAGKLDFAFIDALKPAVFAEKHMPGAVNLPADTITEETAAQLIGAKDRPVVIYCGSYG